MNHKPFNLDHAKAGAPVQLEDGTEATIIKFDGRNPNFPLVVLIGPRDYARSASLGGVIGPMYSSDKYADQMLTMKPFGYCEGKPVYAGDKLKFKGAKTSSEGVALDPACKRTDFSEFSWLLQYPVTQINVSQFYEDCSESGTPLDGGIDSYRNFANHAIQHGIDNGYLLDAAGRIDVKNILGRVARRVGITDKHFGFVDIEPAMTKRELAIAKHFFNFGSEHEHLGVLKQPTDDQIKDQLTKVKP